MIREIPNKIRKRVGKRSDEYYHYELVKIYPHMVMYKCKENGKIECFSKNDFVKNELIEN